MKYSKIKKILRKISEETYYTNFIKSEEYLIKKSKIIINKNTTEEKTYPDVNHIQLFKSGFMILHSPTSEESESQNIDLQDIETLTVEK